MAFPIVASPPFALIKTLFPNNRSLSLATWNFNFPRPIQCKASYKVSYDQNQTISRRPSKFQPSIWTHDYIQSLSSEYKEEIYGDQRKVLREKVRIMLCKIENELDQLEFIDVLQRIGVSYHFNKEIRDILDNIYNKQTSKLKKNLHATALKFRLLRQHGYEISTDCFVCFQNEVCNFKKGQFVDVHGMLSMYEASFHSFEDETILDEARDFTTNFLKEYLKQNRGNHVSLLISHALDLPLNWTISRLEARWFINIYEKQENKNNVLLQFAKLDFNILQNNYLEELKCASRWWKETAIVEKLSFARDRIVENFVWNVGANFKPDFEQFRIGMTKINALITTVDDVYDLYGTLEELELFTEAIDRWDLNALDSLPYYMQICFHAVYNFVNEISFESLKKNEKYITTPYLKKAWTDLCKAYLIEAKWYYSGYTPTVEEYMANGCVSIGAHAVFTHGYFSMPHSIEMEDLVRLGEDSNIIRLTATIARVANDYGSYKSENETGDTPKLNKCIMNETGASEIEARDYMKSMMSTLWKKMNKEAQTSSFSQNFIDTNMNAFRICMFMYQYGDAYSIPDSKIQNRIMSLVFEPIP